MLTEADDSIHTIHSDFLSTLNDNLLCCRTLNDDDDAASVLTL